MIWISIILILVGIGLCIYGKSCLSKSQQIKIKKTKEQEEYNSTINVLQQQIEELQNKSFSLNNKILEERRQIQEIWDNRKKYLEEQLSLHKDRFDYASQQYVAQLEQRYEEAEKEYDKKMRQIEEEESEIEYSLEKIKNALAAGVQAQLREREKEDKLDFYKIVISEKDMADIKKLNIFKQDFNQPAIINKLIWSNYFQKKVTEMCNRILGNRTVCGIYKITNLTTEQCYIGQSVNISERWKQHCKCGCDIDASATNRLYQNMISTGIWNFTFELMEECPRDQLNEKEKFWINMYQSDIYGLNSTKGNK